MLYLKELELINFRSWKEILLTGLSQKGLLLIQGTNGSGKSSIRQGFEYLILDKTSDGLSVDELPRNKTEQCKLRCVIQKDDSEIEIIKYRNHKKNGNKTILSINGNTDLTSTDRRVTQHNIEEVLGIHENAVFISTIFSANSPSFPEVKEADRKQVVYNALDLYKYRRYYDLAQYKYDEFKEKMLKVEKRAEYIEELIANFAAEVDHLKTKRDPWKEEVRVKVDRLMAEKDKYTVTDTTSLYNNIEVLRKRFVKEDEGLLAKKREEVQAKLSARTKIDDAIVSIETDLENVESGTCPIFLDECSRLVDRAKQAKMKLEPQLAKMKNKFTSVREKTKKLFDEIADLEDKCQQNNDLTAEISRIKDMIALTENDNKHVQENLDRIDEQIKEISTAENPYIGLISEKQDKIKGFLQEKEELALQTQDILEEQKYYDFWREGFSKAGIPSLKSDGFLSEIEDSVNRYLSSIGDKMYVEISAQSQLKSKDIREKISYQIHHPDKSITDFQSYSSGEQQRVKIADIFSFYDLIGKFNIMILDEVLERSLDNVGLEGVIGLLNAKMHESNVGTIAVISHNDKIKDKFDNVLHIVKKHGISTIQEEW